MFDILIVEILVRHHIRPKSESSARLAPDLDERRRYRSRFAVEATRDVKILPTNSGHIFGRLLPLSDFGL